MIRRTLAATQAATYSIDLPSAGRKGMPSPTGTGFFVSPDGWFVTAAHVVSEGGSAAGKPRPDIAQGWLMKERRGMTLPSAMCQGLTLEYIDPRTDFALLKLDFSQNSGKAHLVGRSSFPFVEVSSRELDEGEPVYAFGYPLGESALVVDGAASKMGSSTHCPRTTSAIVSSTVDASGMVSSAQDVRVYALGKALNYGNSGGPVISSETGKVHAFCSRFQPVGVPQPHLKDPDGKAIVVYIPSLYGIVSSLSNPDILDQLRSRKIPISTA